MKRLILVTVILLMTMIAGCGSEVSVMLPLYYDSSPTVTNFYYSQDVVNSYVDGTVEFYAPDSDLGSITITVVNSRGTEIERTISSLGAFAGRLSGTIPFTIDYLNYRPDDYTFTIYLIDWAGYMSNPVYGSFRIK